MDSYKDISDEEMIALLRGGQSEITEYILDKYKNLVRKRANAMFLVGGDNEDLIQEGMIGLFKAIRDFQPDRETSFAYFADLCVSRQIIHAVERAGRKKHQPLNTYVSLSEQEEQSREWMDVLMTLDNANPEQLLIARENWADLEDRIAKELSGLEKKVMHYYLQGLGYREIAQVMGKSPKTIDNALQRIRGKLSRIGR